MKSQDCDLSVNVPCGVQKVLFAATDSLSKDTTFKLNFQVRNRMYYYKIQKLGDLYVYTKTKEDRLYTDWPTVTLYSYFFGGWGLLVNGIKPPLDKTLHFSAGYLTSVSGYIIAKKLNAKHPMIIGISSSILVGAGKEIVYDYLLKKGTPTVNDFIWTAIGGGYGVITIKLVIK